MILLVASDDCLPLMNLVWSALTRRNLYTLRAKNVVYNLKSALSREVGRMFWGMSGFLPGLGRATTTADNISGGNMEEVAASL